jgi:hypothetical protein
MLFISMLSQKKMPNNTMVFGIPVAQTDQATEPMPGQNSGITTMMQASRRRMGHFGRKKTLIFMYMYRGFLKWGIPNVMT